ATTNKTSSTARTRSTFTARSGGQTPFPALSAARRTRSIPRLGHLAPCARGSPQAAFEDHRGIGSLYPADEVVPAVDRSVEFCAASVELDHDITRAESSNRTDLV